MRSSRFIILFFLLTSSLFSYSQEWHKYQIGTGIGNCGPAAVAMSIQWATGLDVSVQSVRSEIGYTHPLGSTTFEELLNVLKLYKLTAYMVDFSSIQQMKNLITNNSILIVVVDLNLLYGEEGGHYIVLYENRITVNSDSYQDEVAVADSLRLPDIYLSTTRIWNAMKYKRAIRIFK
jgi:hypothetical protein